MALMMLLVFSPEMTPSKLKAPVADPLLVLLVALIDMDVAAPCLNHRPVRDQL
jgi:hypothetical protein